MNEISLKRLALIKRLFMLGVAQSYEPEPLNGFSIFSFHDSLEMFVKLCTDSKGIKSKGAPSLMDYFTIIPELGMQPQINNLNIIRNKIKHGGLFPNTLDIESCRTNALEFLRISSKSILDEDFDSVSLIELIQFENVRVLLKKAEFQLLHEDYPNAIANAAYAFRELLYCYEQNKHRYYKSLFDLSHDFHHIGFNVQLDTKIDHALNEIGDAIECLNERFRSKYYG